MLVRAEPCWLPSLAGYRSNARGIGGTVGDAYVFGSIASKPEPGLWGDAWMGNV